MLVKLHTCLYCRECEQYARHMTKPDPRDDTILNFNSSEEQEAVEVVFNNAITPLAEACSQSMHRRSYWFNTMHSTA